MALGLSVAYHGLVETGRKFQGCDFASFLGGDEDGVGRVEGEASQTEVSNNLSMGREVSAVRFLWVPGSKEICC